MDDYFKTMSCNIELDPSVIPDDDIDDLTKMFVHYVDSFEDMTSDDDIDSSTSNPFNES